MKSLPMLSSILFQSTPPARGATSHRIRYGGLHIFQSTPPARGATTNYHPHNKNSEISIHAPREGGDLDFLGTVLDFIISIHAPREGGDSTAGSVTGTAYNISIHAPREGGDAGAARPRQKRKRFQSTPPARGATSISWVLSLILSFQSTPPARGATMFLRRGPRYFMISIHAPREGGDGT